MLQIYLILTLDNFKIEISYEFKTNYVGTAEIVCVVLQDKP